MSGGDILVWPDGDWCLAEDLHEYTWKSDDYRVLTEGTDEHAAWVREQSGSGS